MPERIFKIRKVGKNELELFKKLATLANTLSINQWNYKEQFNNPNRDTWVMFTKNNKLIATVSIFYNKNTCYIDNNLNLQEIQGDYFSTCAVIDSEQGKGYASIIRDFVLGQIQNINPENIVIGRVTGSRAPIKVLLVSTDEKQLDFEKKITDFGDEKLRGIPREESKNLVYWYEHRNFKRAGFAPSHLGPVYTGQKSKVKPKYFFKKIEPNIYEIST